jgi:hypothetical protein
MLFAQTGAATFFLGITGTELTNQKVLFTERAQAMCCPHRKRATKLRFLREVSQKVKISQAEERIIPSISIRKAT